MAGWHDLIGDVSSKSNELSSPMLLPFTGMFRSWFFKPGSRCDLQYHIPHDYIPNTDLFLHVHWSHTGDEIEGVFEIEHHISYAKGYGQMDFIYEKTLTQTIDCTGIKFYVHNIDEIQITGDVDNLLDVSMVEPDMLITNALVVTKIPKITGSNKYPTILCADIHYQSSDVSTPNKNYPFK